MSVDWPRWADEITRLYVTEDKSAEETIQFLRDQHNVKITIKQFKSRYSGLKKLRANEWMAVKRVIQKRKTDGKSSAVFLNDRQIDPNRLAREMRRYSGARGRDSTGDAGVIDLGVNTVNKHRLEIRTPVPGLAQCPKGSPCFTDKTAGNATISIEESTRSNDHSPGPTGWMMSHVDLEDLDLSTPKLGTAEASYCAGSLSDFQLMINNTETQLSPSWLFEDNMYTSMTNHQYQSTGSNPMFPTHINLPAFNLPYACPSPKLGRTIWSSNLPQSTFLLLPDVCTIINSMETSSSLARDNMVRLQQLVDNHAEITNHRNNVSLHLFGMQSASNIHRLASTLLNLFFQPNYYSGTSYDSKALTSFIKTDHRILYLLFATAIHHCCNNAMIAEDFVSFCRWIFLAGVKEQLSSYLQKCPAISNAFAEAILRASRCQQIIETSKTYVNVILKIMEIYRDESLHISKKVCGLLLHAVIIHGGSTDLLDLLVTRGAEVDTIATITDGALKHKGTPLVQAVYEEKPYIVEYFLELGSTKGRTLDRDDIFNAITVALEIGSVESAELLLSKGIDMHHQICVDSKKLEELLSDQDRKGKNGGFPMLCRLLARHQPTHRHRRLLDDVVDAAASGSQALSKILLDHSIIQEKSLDIVLCQAVMLGNSLAVRTLLRRGVDPDARNRQTGSYIFGDVDPQLLLSAPLQLALGIDYDSLDDITMDILLLLLKAGAHANEVMLLRLSHRLHNWKTEASLIYSIFRKYQSDILGASALALAAYCGDMAGCNLLLDLGAPINLYGSCGKNALQAASSNDKLLLVQFLLDQGADVNVPAHDNGGRTALQAAVECGCDDIAKCLLDAKADVRAPPAKKMGMTVLEAFAHRHLRNFSRKGRCFNMVSGFRDWLSRGAPINRPDGDHGKVLHLLIRSSAKPAIECLDIALQAGARIEDEDWFPRGPKTPLQVAAEFGKIGAVRLLLKYGAQINAPPDDKFGRTALQAAVCGRKLEDKPAMVELLLSVGADVNAPPARRGGITALQGAAISGNINIAKQLLDHGADVNAAPAVEEGRTAIEGAAEHGRLDMVRYLISAGAVGDTEKGFSRAIELAENENHFTVADVLRDQQDLSTGFSTGMDDVLGGDFFSLVPMQGFVLPDESL